MATTDNAIESTEQLSAWLDAPHTRRRDQSQLVLSLFKGFKFPESRALDVVGRCAIQARADGRVSFGTLLAEHTAIEFRNQGSPLDFSQGKARTWCAYLMLLDRPRDQAAGQ